MRLLIAVLLLTACGGKDHETTDVEPENFFAIIYGRVVNDEGTGIVDAQVRATSLDDCGDSTVVATGTTRSTTNGRYSVRVTYTDPEPHCVRVFVTPPSQALLPDSIELANVRFARVVTDSIEQTLTLRIPGGGGPGGPINPKIVER